MKNPFDTPPTVAQASEFLKQWPSLVPAIQRLVHAKLREKCERRPEVSQAARDAACAEVKDWNRPGSDVGNAGTFVQRAMDAAVAENDTKLRSVVAATELTENDNSTMGMVTSVCDIATDQCKQVARLTKELAECHGQPTLSDNALNDVAYFKKRYEEVQSVAVEKDRLWSEACNKLAAAQSALAAMTSERDRLRDTKWEGITKLESALAEREKELKLERRLSEAIKRADCAVSDCGHNQQYLWSPDGVGKQILCAVCSLQKRTKELSTELAARETTRADRDRWVESWHKDTIALRAQLQQAEQERDEARESIWKYESARAMATLQAERDSLRAELAKTQKVVRRVEQELQWARATLAEERTVSGIEKLIAERDALQKQNVALEEARESAVLLALSNRDVADKLEARNAELVKALEFIKNSTFSGLAQRTAEKALNQSPDAVS